jgi:hypothetical protein
MTAFRSCVTPIAAVALLVGSVSIADAKIFSFSHVLEVGSYGIVAGCRLVAEILLDRGRSW